MSPFDRVQLPDGSDGRSLYRTDLLATAVFVVAAIIATVAPSPFRIPFAVLSTVLFAAGCVAFLWAYVAALGRSRSQAISVGNIYGLSGSAPAAVRRRFHTLTALQSVVAIAAAAIRPFTALAFGILVPMLGLGLGGLWAARHGDFGPRPDRRRRLTQPKGSESNG